MQRAVLISMIVLLPAGCGGPDGPPRGAIEGTVTLDGAAIERGSITFRPTGGTQGPAAGAPIAQGRYRLSAADGPVVGRNRVEIYAPRKTGKKVPAPMGNPGELTDEIVEMIPPQYNTRSTLEQDVQPGTNNQDFQLTTK